MQKLLKINYFPQGYDIEDLNCIELLHAQALSSFCYDYYFYYSFYCSLVYNWLSTEDSDITDFQNRIMNKLGIEYKYIIVEDQEKVLDNIKECINNDKPVILRTNYKCLFYSDGYMLDNMNNHATYIAGYDSEKQLIFIQDFEAVERYEIKHTRGQIFFKMRLTEEMVKDIWNKTCRFFEEKNSIFMNKLFYIEKYSEPQINCYMDLIREFIATDYSKNNLLKVLDFPYNSMNKDEINRTFHYLRRPYHRSANILFDVFEKAFALQNINEPTYKEFYELKDNYYKFKDLLISKMHANALREKIINEQERDKIIKDVYRMDSELFMFIKNLYEEYLIKEI